MTRFPAPDAGLRVVLTGAAGGIGQGSEGFQRVLVGVFRVQAFPSIKVEAPAFDGHVKAAPGHGLCIERGADMVVAGCAILEAILDIWPAETLGIADRGIREGINRLRTQVMDRSIPASELAGYTISLSNFGMFAGRYATPVVVPPCVAIVGAGRARHQMTPVMGGVESHKVIPLSVTFDHRVATGGEAARFLRAMMDDLALAN